jgi:hypothetical protein
VPDLCSAITSSDRGEHTSAQALTFLTEGRTWSWPRSSRRCRIDQKLRCAPRGRCTDYTSEIVSDGYDEALRLCCRTIEGDGLAVDCRLVAAAARHQLGVQLRAELHDLAEVRADPDTPNNAGLRPIRISAPRAS